MKFVIAIFLIQLNFNLQAEDLTDISSFKLNSNLIQQAKLIEKNKKQLKVFSKSKNKALSEADPNVMYTEIYEYLNGRHLDIGKTLANNILKLNRGFDLGQQNFNGITWQKPFANFSIGINRVLSPDLFDAKRWIVDDTFTITIDAATYLSNLKEAKEITISDSQLASFAGIGYKRTYRYIHFSPDYTSGLTSDFTKLFMSFWKMRQGDVFLLDQYEIMSREDSMSFKGGGLVSTPSSGSFVVNGGVLASINKISKVLIQSIGPNDLPKPDEFLRISSIKEKQVKVEAVAKLQMDFFKLLKITLLSYDLEYSYDEADTKYFSFKKNEVHNLLKDPQGASELNQLINLKKFDLQKILPNIVQGEYRSTENTSSKYAVLLWGGETSRGSQTILVNSGNNSKAFVVHKSKSVRYTESVGAKITSIILEAIFQSDQLLSQYMESLTRNLDIQFEANRSALEGADYDRIREVESSDKLSFSVTKEFKTRKAFKKLNDWQKSKERTSSLNFLNRMCVFNNAVYKSLDAGEVQSPLAITSTMRIEKAGIEHFNNLDIKEAIDTINEICQVSETESSKQEYCFKMLEGKYKAYYTPLKANGKIQILKLKDFLNSFNNQFDDIAFYKKLFGDENVFFSGQLEATRIDGNVLTTYFHEGDFRGLGVVDNFIRQSGTAMPAPIFNKVD